MKGFSRMNIIKTDVRNKLVINTRENLMRVSLHDSDETTFQFNKTFDKWVAVKSRRILMYLLVTVLNVCLYHIVC